MGIILADISNLIHDYLAAMFRILKQIKTVVSFRNKT